MIAITDIEALITTWIETYTGLATGKVILLNDNGPKPDPPYIAFRLATITPVGHECRSSPYDNAGDNVVKISGVRDMVVNLQTYGLNAYGILENLSHYIYVEASIDFLETEGLSFIDTIALNNLRGLNDLRFEERASMDLLFRFATQLENVDVGWIETINVTGQLKNPDKNFDFNIDLT